MTTFGIYAIIVSNDTLSEVRSTKKNFTLTETFLFSGIPTEVAESLIRTISPEVVEFEKGEEIYSPSQYEKKMGFVLSGECSVLQKHAATNISLKPILPGDTFGILTIFLGEKDFPTHITARKRSKILFISSDGIHRLIDKSPAVALNIITFLSERIAFLNKKIDTYSSGSVEEKLASYILAICRETGKSELPFNKALVAQSLGVGRASLYRALNSMCENGIITFNRQKTIIVDIKKLERLKK